MSDDHADYSEDSSVEEGNTRTTARNSIADQSDDVNMTLEVKLHSHSIISCTFVSKLKVAWLKTIKYVNVVENKNLKNSLAH